MQQQSVGERMEHIAIWPSDRELSWDWQATPLGSTCCEGNVGGRTSSLTSSTIHQLIRLIQGERWSWRNPCLVSWVTHIWWKRPRKGSYFEFSGLINSFTMCEQIHWHMQLPSKELKTHNLIFKMVEAVELRKLCKHEHLVLPHLH
jgi:hypothetical protein